MPTKKSKELEELGSILKENSRLLLEFQNFIKDLNINPQKIMPEQIKKIEAAISMVERYERDVLPQANKYLNQLLIENGQGAAIQKISSRRPTKDSIDYLLRNERLFNELYEFKDLLGEEW